MEEFGEDCLPLVIIANGTRKTMAGFAGDDAPRSNFFSLIGRTHGEVTVGDRILSGTYVGDEAQHWRNVLSLSHPIENGIIKNWDDMEMLWRHTFEWELRVKPEEFYVMLTEPSINPSVNRERMAQTMYETFGVPWFYLASQPFLSLLCSGRTTGVVWDSGEGFSSVVPIYAGSTLRHGVKTMPLGGDEINRYMLNLLSERRHPFTSPADLETVRSIKEQLGYVALDFDREMTRAVDGAMPERLYNLPDGQVISVGNERFQGSEALFQPGLMDLECSIQETINSSILSCDVDLRTDFYHTILMAGGNTMFPGLADRLRKEIRGLVSPSTRVGIIAPPERKFTGWIGGSVLSSLSTFPQLLISKLEYEEFGSNIVHRRCLH
ncbi:actin family [Flagelloscypha sp. PMI_526]|nr:actin family [Flagelloscypha sp. PMI_526]